jgi:hypothetical protein
MHEDVFSRVFWRELMYQNEGMPVNDSGSGRSDHAFDPR